MREELLEMKDFFNEAASSWDETCIHDMKKIEYILDLLNIKEKSHILDVGTGTGILIPSLYKRVKDLGRIDAIDLSENMIGIARRKYKYNNVRFSCGDVLNLKEGINSYDYIICYSMFPHFQSKKREAIQILGEKLKPGGKIIICHSQSREAINNLHKGVDQAVKDDNLPNINIMRDYFKDAKLDIIKEVDNEDMFVIIGHDLSII